MKSFLTEYILGYKFELCGRVGLGKYGHGRLIGTNLGKENADNPVLPDVEFQQCKEDPFSRYGLFKTGVLRSVGNRSGGCNLGDFVSWPRK